MRFVRTALWGVLLPLALVACGDISDDLLPSDHDRRSAVEIGVIGPEVGQLAPDFTVPDSFGDDYTLSAELPATGGVVLYFTMWCPVCDSHMSHMRDTVIPRYPGVEFLAVDYVSGSVADARSAQESHGFGGPGFRVLADLGDGVESRYGGTMGTTVVIDRGGVVQMNEDYRNGTRLEEVLAGLE
ncbi:MAG: redoxin domain-containing protein [Deferrisomatales bacterium]|nr:redoxin domain-containing protein [Deferrisomatales bacterium]